ncbi:MAG: type II secretion system GspH family protein, partial [Phycisphaerales bacterium]|nr:type II secretion system GspH family protein [Phycisphaerales bacterium]
MGEYLGSSMRKAFTLVELLVVIAIIATLMAILLPALAGSRRQARATVGAVNMRSLNQVMAVYTNDNKDTYLTPFADRDPASSNGAGWADAVSVGDRSIFWRFVAGDDRWHTDFFAYYWYSFLADYHGGSRFREEQLSPGDGTLQGVARSSADFKHNPASLFPSSYLYSPTFWSTASRFPGSRPSMRPALLESQTTASVASPAAKVIIWLRADFAQQVNAGVGVAWNNPRAQTWVGLADGSCDQISMRQLTQRAAQTTGGDVDLAPTALIPAPNEMPVLGVPTD